MSAVEECGLCGLRLSIDEIYDRALILADYAGVRFFDEIAYRRGVPVVPARLQDRHLATLQLTAVKQYLRHLGGFPRAGGRGDNQSLLSSQGVEQWPLDFEDSKSGFRVAFLI